MRDWKGIAGVLIIFLLGGALGAVIDRHICQIRLEQMPHGGPGGLHGGFGPEDGPKGGPGNMAEEIVRHISRDLNLDKAQREKLHVIMETMHKKMNALHKQLFPQMKLIMEETDNGTLSILNAAQRDKFRESIERRNKHEQGFFNE